MTINGGGDLTTSYQLDGYIAVHRRADLPWEDFVPVPDVAMVQLDPLVAPIQLTGSANLQVARGTVQTDSDGSRRAKVLFAPAIQAMIAKEDGTTVELDDVHVHATE
jgi:hypothetical protein